MNRKVSFSVSESNIRLNSIFICETFLQTFFSSMEKGQRNRKDFRRLKIFICFFSRKSTAAMDFCQWMKKAELTKDCLHSKGSSGWLNAHNNHVELARSVIIHSQPRKTFHFPTFLPFSVSFFLFYQGEHIRSLSFLCWRSPKKKGKLSFTFFMTFGVPGKGVKKNH